MNIESSSLVDVVFGSIHKNNKTDIKILYYTWDINGQLDLTLTCGLA